MGQDNDRDSPPVATEGSTGQAVPLLVLRARRGERDALLSAGHPYFASRAGGDRIGVLLTDGTDWEEIRELVTESYRILAPKKLTALLGWRPNTTGYRQNPRSTFVLSAGCSS